MGTIADADSTIRVAMSKTSLRLVDKFGARVRKCGSVTCFTRRRKTGYKKASSRPVNALRRPLR